MLDLAATAGWDAVAASSCRAWRPTGRATVVRLQRFDDTCLGRADRSTTTVFSAPLPARLLGAPWSRTSAPWPGAVPGHDVRRLADGPLAAVSSTYADAIGCADCDQLLVVLGPQPQQVRDLVRGVRVAQD